jgi:hypothetical protein
MKRESYYIMVGIPNPVLKVFLAILFGVAVVLLCPVPSGVTLLS